MIKYSCPLLCIYWCHNLTDQVDGRSKSEQERREKDGLVANLPVILQLVRTSNYAYIHFISVATTTTTTTPAPFSFVRRIHNASFLFFMDEQKPIRFNYPSRELNTCFPWETNGRTDGEPSCERSIQLSCLVITHLVSNHAQVSQHSRKVGSRRSICRYNYL